jgi:signal transduction histidine kinase
MGIILIFLAGFGLFLYMNYRLKKKSQKDMEKVNSDIEKVNEQLRMKIADLENFRDSLTEKFEQAIDEVRNKDNILIIQSRYVALSDMIENISMKWESNLVAIQEQISLLKRDFAEDTLSGESLDVIVGESMKILYDMSEKIDDFRDFFRPHLTSSLFYVKSTIHKSISFVEEYYHKFNISIIYEEKEKDIKIEGYPNELALIVLNIINNSLDAIVERKIEEPVIRISLRKEFGRVILEILDNAGGVNEEILDNVFEAFVTGKKDTDSCGLGLYIAREIVLSRFNGAISIRNENGGALVKIIF